MALHVDDVDLLGRAHGLACYPHMKDATCGHRPKDKGIASNSSKSCTAPVLRRLMPLLHQG